jgi:hypothetical protein
MQQSCTYGSVRGALGNRRPYRDKTAIATYIRSALVDFGSRRRPSAGRFGGLQTNFRPARHTSALAYAD